MPCRPGPAGWIRCARASTSSACRACAAGVEVSAAVAYGSGPGPDAGPAAGTPGLPRVKVPVGPGEHAPHLGRGSPSAASRSSRVRRSASSSTSAASGMAGRLAASSAATRSASGSREHCAASSLAASGSASTWSPISVRSRATASWGGSTSRFRRARRLEPPARPVRPGWSLAPCRSGCRAAAAGSAQPIRRCPAQSASACPPAGCGSARPARGFSRGCPGRARPARAGTRPARLLAGTGWAGS